MRNLFIVFRFELRSLLQKKTIRYTTLLLCIVMLLITSIPTIMTLFSNMNEETTNPPEQSSLIENAAYVMEDGVMDQALLFGFLLETSPVMVSSEAQLRNLVEDNTHNYGVVIHSPSSFSMIVRDKSQYDYSEQILSGALEQYQIHQNYLSMGIDPQQVQSASVVQVNANTIILGKDSGQGFLFAHAIMIVVYMLILLYGTSVSTAVAREKDSRTMELLITSTSPKELMLGKVFASGLLGIIQVSLIVLSTFVGFQLNKGNYPDMITSMLQDSMATEAIVVFILFTISGYLLYLFIYAALGSLVSKVEDVTNVVAPVTFLFVIAYLIASVGMNLPNALFVKISSYIPFVSLFTMPIRAMLVSVSLFEIAISLAIMMATTYLIACLSIYIYRAGSLNYGNKMSLLKLMEDWLKKDKA